MTNNYFYLLLLTFIILGGFFIHTVSKRDDICHSKGGYTIKVLDGTVCAKLEILK